MKTLLLACDFEEFNLPLDFGKQVSEEVMLEKTYEGIQKFYECIQKHSIRLTFFITEKIAERYSDLLRQLIMQGHEIGFHASVSIRDIKAGETIKSIKSAKEKTEYNLGTEIYGFRNHKLSVIPAFIIKEAGFIYDNTLHPTYVPGRYCNFFKSRQINSECGLINLPISVTPVLRLPFSWVWFRNLGLNYLKSCTSWVLLTQDYVNIYFHSWDFADIEKDLGFKLPFIVTRNSGNKAVEILNYYLNWCRINKIQTETIHRYLIKNGILVL